MTINRLPCAVDPEECGTSVDMTWFDLTKRKMTDDRTGRERVLAQYQGRPLLENKIDTENLNLVLVKQDGINCRAFYFLFFVQETIWLKSAKLRK